MTGLASTLVVVRDGLVVFDAIYILGLLVSGAISDFFASLLELWFGSIALYSDALLS